MIGCNALALAGAMALGLNPLASLHNQLAIGLFAASAVALVLTKSRRANIALLAFMALQYPASAVLEMMGW